MKIETAFVSKDEACHGLREEPRLLPGPNGSTSWRWCQTVFVIRGDTVAAHTTDLGPAENFKDVTPLLMPSFGENTVAQLREHAEKNRQDSYWAQRSRQMQAESTLVQDHIEQIEMVKTYLKRHARTAKELTR